MATWSIIKTIDQGGFGKVYEVRSSEGIRGALKELKNPNTAGLRRFEREIRILQSLSHTNIISIYESNLNGNPPTIGPYYIMEFMSGGSLREKMFNILTEQRKLFAQKWALETVILPVIEAIELAHSKDVLHRDIKPANLLFTDQNQIKVADWGIGKDVNRNSIALTVGGIGTSGYCSSEQWFALPNVIVDGRTDIYSLGIIFYEMMTGRLPQVYNNAGQTFNIPAPSQNHSSISPQLDNAILKMIAYDRGTRYQTISEVKTVLTSIYRSM